MGNLYKISEIALRKLTNIDDNHISLDMKYSSLYSETGPNWLPHKMNNMDLRPA